MVRTSQTVEKASQSFLRKQKIKLKTFSAGACTWQKKLLRLQVWNLSAISRQMMRAADCKELAESPEGDFRQAQRCKPLVCTSQEMIRLVCQLLHCSQGLLQLGNQVTMLGCLIPLGVDNGLRGTGNKLLIRELALQGR